MKNTAKNIIRKAIRTLAGTALAAAVGVSGIQAPQEFWEGGGSPIIAEAATVTAKLPITSYTVSNGDCTTYMSKDMSQPAGYISPGDLCTIQQMYPNGALQVTYPVKSGVRTLYVWGTDFFGNPDWSSYTIKLGRQQTAYAKPIGATAMGTVFAEDEVSVITTANGRTQVLFPVSSGGYKMGWVDGIYSIDVDHTALNPAQKKAITFNRAFYANMYPDLKSAYGYDEKMLYSHYLTHGIKEGRTASPLFNPVHYLAQNPDLKQAYGSDYEKAYEHWVTHGYREYRDSSYYYNGTYYRGRYMDLSDMNSFDLAIHYSRNGIWEKRGGNVSGAVPNIVIEDPQPEPTAQKIANYAVSQVGIGDSKGNNNVIYNTWFYNRKVSGSGYAWCQAFVSYCAQQVGALNSAIPKTAGCQTAVNWFKQRGRFQNSKYYGGNYTPKTGDLVFYTTNGRTASHVGIVIGAPTASGHLQVVEGNVLDANGDYKVTKFTGNAKRTVNNAYVMGYAVPAY